MDRFIIIIFALFVGISFLGCDDDAKKSRKLSVEPIKDLTIIVTFDNNIYDSNLRTAWGFSCVLKFAEKTILFDTGGDSSTLLSNMDQLKIDPKEIDEVMLSHIHHDHVGGLTGFLKRNSNDVVYVPLSFPESIKNEIKSYGANIKEIDVGTKLFDNVYSTGQLGTSIIEQSLILNTKKGLVIITGCAHPNIVEIVKKSIQLVNRKPLLIMGGFHLRSKTESEINDILNNLKEMEVTMVGPTHCTGDKARHLFQQAYGKNFMDIGVGKVITIQSE